MFVPEIFVNLALPMREGKARMTRRSASDKEYFFQDWIEMQLGGAYGIHRQGRNSHPDYILTKDGLSVGLEAKSLENRQANRRDPSVAPCRTDVDFNSAIPCGFINFRNQTLRCYYAFALYDTDSSSTLHVNGICVAFVDGNYLNRDFNLAVSHRNVSKGGFGSYGDGFIRTRKMYRFPNPLTYEPFRYKSVFVTEDKIVNPRVHGLKQTIIVTKTGKDGVEYVFNVYELA